MEFNFHCALSTTSLHLCSFFTAGSLLEYLRSNKYMVRQTNVLTDMAFQISSAMKYLEKEKYIHRDLVRSISL